MEKSSAQFAANYRTLVANTVLLDYALATMGAGLPPAMAAAMLFPKRRVIAIYADGGFMTNSQEIETAVRLGLNLVVLVVDDSAYGMIRWKQAIAGFDDWGLTFSNPDFVKYAEAYGASGHRFAAGGSRPNAELLLRARRCASGGGPSRLLGKQARPN
jgi:acetolactate synthase-1/2/3 large subunit